VISNRCLYPSAARNALFNDPMIRQTIEMDGVRIGGLHFNLGWQNKTYQVDLEIVADMIGWWQGKEYNANNVTSALSKINTIMDVKNVPAHIRVDSSAMMVSYSAHIAALKCNHAREYANKHVIELNAYNRDRTEPLNDTIIQTIANHPYVALATVTVSGAYVTYKAYPYIKLVKHGIHSVDDTTRRVLSNATVAVKSVIDKMPSVKLSVQSGDYYSDTYTYQGNVYRYDSAPRDESGYRLWEPHPSKTITEHLKGTIGTLFGMATFAIVVGCGYYAYKLLTTDKPETNPVSTLYKAIIKRERNLELQKPKDRVKMFSLLKKETLTKLVEYPTFEDFTVVHHTPAYPAMCLGKDAMDKCVASMSQGAKIHLPLSSSIDKECPPAFGNALVGIGVANFVPKIAKSCVHNEYIALRERVTKEVVQPKPKYWSHLSEYRKQNPTRFGLPEKIPILEYDEDEWLDKQEPAKRLRYAKGRVLEVLKKRTRHELFVKRENTLKGDTSKSWVFNPRAIQTVMPSVMLNEGPFISSFSKFIGELDKEISNNAWAYAWKGDDLDKWFDNQVSRFNDPVAMSIDLERMDSSHSSDSGASFAEDLKIFFAPGHVVRTYEEGLMIHGVTSNGIKYTAFFKLASGNPETSAKNGMTCKKVNTYGAWKLFDLVIHTQNVMSIENYVPKHEHQADDDTPLSVLKHRLFTENRSFGFNVATNSVDNLFRHSSVTQGDDNYVMAERATAMCVLTNLHNHFLSAGFRLTVTVHENIECAEFISSRFVSYAGGHAIAPKPFRQLAKVFWCHDNAAIDPMGHARAVATSIMHLAVMPVLGTAILKVLELTEGVPFKTMEDYVKYHPHSMSKLKRSDFVEHYRIVYGITLEEILEIEELIKSIKTLPASIQHPKLTHCINVDLGLAKAEETFTFPDDYLNHQPPVIYQVKDAREKDFGFFYEKANYLRTKLVHHTLEPRGLLLSIASIDTNRVKSRWYINNAIGALMGAMALFGPCNEIMTGVSLAIITTITGRNYLEELDNSHVFEYNIQTKIKRQMPSTEAFTMQLVNRSPIYLSVATVWEELAFNLCPAFSIVVPIVECYYHNSFYPLFAHSTMALARYYSPALAMGVHVLHNLGVQNRTQCLAGIQQCADEILTISQPNSSPKPASVLCLMSSVISSTPRPQKRQLKNVTSQTSKTSQKESATKQSTPTSKRPSSQVKPTLKVSLLKRTSPLPEPSSKTVTQNSQRSTSTMKNLNKANSLSQQGSFPVTARDSAQMNQKKKVPESAHRILPKQNIALSQIMRNIAPQLKIDPRNVVAMESQKSQFTFIRGVKHDSVATHKDTHGGRFNYDETMVGTLHASLGTLELFGIGTDQNGIYDEFPLNPLMFVEMPDQQEELARWAEFRIANMHFHFTSALGTDQKGIHYCSYNPDPNTPPKQDRVDDQITMVENRTGTHAGPIWSYMDYRVPLETSMNWDSKEMYLMHRSAEEDASEYVQGVIQTAAFGTENQNVIGRAWVEMEIHLTGRTPDDHIQSANLNFTAKHSDQFPDPTIPGTSVERECANLSLAGSSVGQINRVKKMAGDSGILQLFVKDTSDKTNVPKDTRFYAKMSDLETMSKSHKYSDDPVQNELLRQQWIKSFEIPNITPIGELGDKDNILSTILTLFPTIASIAGQTPWADMLSPLLTNSSLLGKLMPVDDGQLEAFKLAKQLTEANEALDDALHAVREKPRFIAQIPVPNDINVERGTGSPVARNR